MRMAYGIGDAKLRDFGELFLRVIGEHCRERHLSTDEVQSHAQRTKRTKRTARTNSPKPNAERETAFRLFQEGASIESVRRATGRALRTVVEYLCDYIRDTRPTSIDVWVAPETRARVAEAANRLGMGTLKPIFVALGEEVSYEQLQIVRAHLQGNSDRKNAPGDR
jgi:ATP-dependent DNA helicase RecQ